MAKSNVLSIRIMQNYADELSRIELVKQIRTRTIRQITVLIKHYNRPVNTWY